MSKARSPICRWSLCLMAAVGLTAAIPSVTLACVYVPSTTAWPVQVSALAGNVLLPDVPRSDVGLVLLSDGDLKCWRQASALPPSVFPAPVPFESATRAPASGLVSFIYSTRDQSKHRHSPPNNPALLQLSMLQPKALQAAAADRSVATKAVRRAIRLVSDDTGKTYPAVDFTDSRDNLQSQVQTDSMTSDAWLNKLLHH